jgi:uncharacterized protein (TIGR03435 family)
MHSLKRVRNIAIALMFLTAAAIAQQTQPQKPSFEVVSVKPAPPMDFTSLRLGGTRGDRLTLPYASLRTLMGMAYRDSVSLEPLEILGGPDWMGSVFYDVQAKADCSGGIASRDLLSLMVQSLLQDRFQLKARVETRDMPVYNLVVGRDGPKLTASADQTPLAPLVPVSQLCGPVPEAPSTAASLPQLPAPGSDLSQFISQLPRGSIFGTFQAGAMTLQGRAAPLNRLANTLKLLTGRQVIDKTDLTGLFDITLKFSLDGLALPGLPPGAATGLPGGLPSSPLSGPLGGPAPSAGAGAPDPVATLFTVIQDLGLKLEQGRGPVQVVVIDSVQKPSEN